MHRKDCSNPSQYAALGLRENAYLVAALLILGVVIGGGYGQVRERLLPVLRTSIPPRLRVALCERRLRVRMLALVFVFLRPINQFIYFQF